LTRALVIGVSGQDGSYLSEQLAADGTEVWGLSQAGLVGAGNSTPLTISLGDRDAIGRLVAECVFDQIYYLAAYHHSAQDLSTASDIVRRSFAVHVDGLVNVLDGMIAARSPARLFYAASSHVFGIVTAAPQDEDTPMTPICAYGISKTAGVQLCRFYRQNLGLHASTGILFNHESPRRQLRFLSRKVSRAAAEIKLGRRDIVMLGDLNARIDWGYSPEYTDAMRRILALDEGGDFVVASGRAARVGDFVAATFARLNLDWRDYVQIDPAMVQKVGRGPLVGDPTKLLQKTGWSALTTMEELAALMVDAEMAELQEGDF
jgi:GDPmannose 4,6-dehydratase